MGSIFSILGNMTDRRDYPHGLFYIDKSHINPYYDLFVRTCCSHIRQGISCLIQGMKSYVGRCSYFTMGAIKIDLKYTWDTLKSMFYYKLCNKANLSHLVTENHNNGKEILMGMQTRIL